MLTHIRTELGLEQNLVLSSGVLFKLYSRCEIRQGVSQPLPLGSGTAFYPSMYSA